MNAADKATWLRQRLAAILGDDETGERMEQPAVTVAEPMAAASARTGATEQERPKTVSAPGKGGREKNAADKATRLRQQLAAILDDDETDAQMEQPTVVAAAPVAAAPRDGATERVQTTVGGTGGGRGLDALGALKGNETENEMVSDPDAAMDGARDGSVMDGHSSGMQMTTDGETEAQRKGRLLRILLRCEDREQ
eukprot:SAG25_NODE_6131_length_585_cov_1.543210_1_plen_195_part_11